MRWNLRMAAAERGIWKSTEMRHRLAEAGLEVSAGKMSRWWTTTPVSMRLDDLDVICAVLDCTPVDLLICEPDKVAAARPTDANARTANGPDTGAGTGAGPGGSGAAPRLGRRRSAPPA
jgi:DNA-binding Xre family transcriptional regulator